MKAGFQRRAPHGFHWSGDLVELEKLLDEKESGAGEMTLGWKLKLVSWDQKHNQF